MGGRRKRGRWRMRWRGSKRGVLGGEGGGNGRRGGCEAQHTNSTVSKSGAARRAKRRGESWGGWEGNGQRDLKMNGGRGKAGKKRETQ